MKPFSSPHLMIIFTRHSVILQY